MILDFLGLLVVVLLPLSSADFSREMMCTMIMYPNGNNLKWDCPEQMNQMISHGLYSTRDMMATRVQMYRDVAYIVFPRFRCGVAATLMYMKMADFCREEPAMYPFPNWDSNNATGPWAMASVVDIYTDENNILWILDTGVINTLTEHPHVVGSPRLLAYCVSSGKMLSRFNLSELICSESRLQHLEVENTEEGGTYVYISDAGTGAILVWNVEEKTGYKVMLPKDSTDHPLSKEVLYISIIRKAPTCVFLYFTFLHSKKMFYIETGHLRLGKLEGSVNTAGVKPGPMVILGTDRKQTMYLRLKGEPEVFTWNAERPFRPKSLALLEKLSLPYFATHFVVGYKGLMWVLESNFNEYINNTHDSIGPRIRLRPILKSFEIPQ